MDCEILISLYIEVASKRESGFKVYCEEQKETSLKLAKHINKAMEENCNFQTWEFFKKDLSTKESIIPVGIVPAMEDVRRDDAHLRDVDYREKVAQAVFNGLIRFYS